MLNTPPFVLKQGIILLILPLEKHTRYQRGFEKPCSRFGKFPNYQWRISKHLFKGTGQYWLVSPRGALPRIFGLPPEPQCFGPSEGGWRPDLLFFVAVYAIQHCFLCLQRLCFGFGFGRGRAFLLRLWRHLREKLGSKLLLVICTANTFSHFVVHHFTFLMVSLNEKKVLLRWSNLSFYG